MSNILINSGLITIGLVLLYYGGHFLIKGAGGIALKFKVAPIIVGLTVVAFGTSAPELFISLLSALQGYTDISLGNVIGSNIINIALVLGMTAVIITIPVANGIIKRDIPLMFVSYAFLLLGTLPMIWEPAGETGVLYRWEGAIMIILICAYVFFLYQYSRKHRDEVSQLVETDAVDEKEARRPLWLLALETVGGIIALAFGSDFLIDGASWLARNVFGASDRFIGITIVALGTSIPELVTSVIAATNKRMDISVGNIVGSNIFNSLMVLGVTSLVRPLNINTSGFTGDLVAMLGISVLLLAILAIRKKLERWSGILFLSVYTKYFFFLLQNRGV